MATQAERELQAWRNWRRVAVHEAGHAVIGRVLGLECGQVFVDAEILLVISSTASRRSREFRAATPRRHRPIDMIERYQIIGSMAGAEAEVAILGDCDGGDAADRRDIGHMLEDLRVDDDRRAAWERRLRRWTMALCRRHVDQIKRLAEARMRNDCMSDEEVRRVIGLPHPMAEIRQKIMAGADEIAAREYNPKNRRIENYYRNAA